MLTSVWGRKPTVNQQMYVFVCNPWSLSTQRTSAAVLRDPDFVPSTADVRRRYIYASGTSAPDVYLHPRLTKDRQSLTFCSAADSRSLAWTSTTKTSRGDDEGGRMLQRRHRHLSRREYIEFCIQLVFNYRRLFHILWYISVLEVSHHVRTSNKMQIFLAFCFAGIEFLANTE